MTTRYFTLFILFAALYSNVAAQVLRTPNEGRPRLSMMDTLSNSPGNVYMYSNKLGDRQNKGSDKFYDSLESKTGRNAFTRFMYDIMTKEPRRDSSNYIKHVDEEKALQRYAGKTIGDITVERHDVFDKAKSFVQKSANGIHVITYEKIIRRDLFFKSGDPLVPEQIVSNNQLLRSRKYFSDIWMEFVPRAEDTTTVDVKIVTQDSWSIGLKLRLRNQQRARIEIYDDNILGTGHRLGLRTNYDWDDYKYGGNMVTYRAPNVLGTFMTFDLMIGRSFEESRLDLALRKDIHKPNDYEFGISYDDDKVKFYQLCLDEDTIVSYRYWNAWLGFSKKLGNWKSSFYMMGRYSNIEFDRRPEVALRFNPRFHNFNKALLGMGVYREKFYAANLIYGFGRKEYLPAGYRADITLGRSWGEFHDDYYVGANYRRGGYTPIGYFMGDAAFGTYIEKDTGDWWQSAVTLNMRWFSHLFVADRTRIRQFVTLNYTRGWNRAEGDDEYLTFNRRYGPRSLKEHMLGHSSGYVKTETVFFTPWQPLGFQVAMFGYVDAGWLGFKPDIFRNDFYTSFGFGVRLRNERLVFNTIELRLGLATGPGGGLAKNRYFQLSSEHRMEQYRFIPTRPTVLDFTQQAF